MNQILSHTHIKISETGLKSAKLPGSVPILNLIICHKDHMGSDDKNLSSFIGK